MAGRCTECGEYHADSGPPCENCGNMSFTPVETVKQCAECGHIHYGESPPCNRCGEMGFRKVQDPDSLQESNDDGTSTFQASAGASTRRDVLKYGAGLLAVGAATVYVVSSDDDYPTTTAPGHAEEASGIRFETVEAEMRGLINDERRDRGEQSLSAAENVDAFATYYNKEFVKNGGGELADVDSEQWDGQFNVSGYHAVAYHYGNDYGRAIERFDSATELAQDTVGEWMDTSDLRRPLMDFQYTKIGFDVHVDDEGGVFLLAVVD